MALGELTIEFLGTVDTRIHFAAKLELCLPESRHDVGEREALANDHQVHVAFRRLATLRHGTLDEGAADAPCQGAEANAEKVGDTEGLPDEASKLFEDRACPVRLEVRLPPLDHSGEDSRLGEPLKLPLDGPVSEAESIDDLPLVEALIGMAVEEPEDGLECVPEERVRERF